MSKKIKNLKWESVSFDDFPVSMTDKLQGFVGLEECTDYGLDKSKKLKKKTKSTKRKLETVPHLTKEKVPSKKVKISNGFIVESCINVIPSSYGENNHQNNTLKNEDISATKQSKGLDDVSVISLLSNKTKKLKLGEATQRISELLPEDMLSWAEFKLPEEIMKALTEIGFKKPTTIQQLTLPAAIYGRRDILGAAETGSGKTLAFGLPILTGIMKIKEKAATKGLDVYEIPYRKSTGKKNKIDIKKEVVKKGRRNKKPKEEKKESSEDGYSSADDNSDIEEETADLKEKTADLEEKTADLDVSSNKEEFLEEYDVPLKKREESVDEGNDSDNENYIHLSDMFDSDDLDSNDDEDESKPDSDNLENDHEIDGNESDGIDEVDKVNEDEQGIGCVKVIDNVELPNHLMVKTGKPLYALIITPTRELAIQVSRHLIAAAKYTGIKVATIVGGMAAVKQERLLKGGPEIVVATPGRLWELINQGQPHLQQLASVKFLAIDETDRMVERGHFDELEPILERLNCEEGHRAARQNFVFSATLTMVHELPSHMRGKKVTKRGKIINRKIEKMTPQQKIKKLIDKIGMTDPKVVDITTKNLGTADTLTECRIACPIDQKDAYLYYVLKKHPGRTIVFCNSIGCVRRLAQLFTILKCNPLPLHASMPQRQRLKNLERFRDDPHGVLVATDVAARGLDIPDVDHVIHYQVPKTAENYVHRSGRTARATKEGLTILMMEPAEAYLYGKIHRTLNKTSDLATFPVPSHSLSPLKDLVKIARDLDSLMLRKKRATQAMGWREKAAKELDIIIDEDDIPITNMDPSIDKAVTAKKRQLELMLCSPFFPRGFSFKYPTLNDPTALQVNTEEKALEVMKKAMESGELKKEKRKSKNQSLLQLEKKLKKLKK